MSREDLDVLFLGHDTTRTGAPLMLLYFLRWLREHTDLRFEVVAVDGGPLEADFAAVAPTTVLADLPEGRLEALARRAGLSGVADRLHDRVASRALAGLGGAPLVYANSISSVRVLPLLDGAPPDQVVVTHVHEMEGAFRAQDEATLELLASRTDHFVAASDLVRRLVIERFGLDPERVVRHYEFIDVDAMVATPPDASALAAARASCAIPPDAAVVGAVGVAQWRKGPDLFVLLAQLLRRREHGREIHFVWLGADPGADETIALRQDIERAGLADRVHLVPPEPTPARWFALFDVYTLTSREDPFPLVCLESSLLGTPIVCFDNTGMAEFAGEGDCGFMVDYLDVEAMADRVMALLDDADERAAVGARAAARVRAEFDVAAAAPSLHRDLERWRPR